MQAWQLQDAKNRFSEVMKRAKEEGRQAVTVHGQRAAVVVSALEFDALIKPRMSFADFLLADASEVGWSDDVVERSTIAAPTRAATSKSDMYLLDTCVVSEARRRTPQAVTWIRSAQPDTLLISAITIGEIMKGIMMKMRVDTPAAAPLVRWLDELRLVYASRILPVDDAVATTWGRMMG